MANIGKQFTDDIVLPDGSIATSVQDVDKYLRANDLAHYSDYSDEYQKSVRLRNEKLREADCFADFINNYKRMIWT